MSNLTIDQKDRASQIPFPVNMQQVLWCYMGWLAQGPKSAKYLHERYEIKECALSESNHSTIIGYLLGTGWIRGQEEEFTLTELGHKVVSFSEEGPPFEKTLFVKVKAFDFAEAAARVEQCLSSLCQDMRVRFTGVENEQ